MAGTAAGTATKGTAARLPRVPGIRLDLRPGDPEWPGQLADLGDDQPYALWLRGSADLRFSCLRSVAIVGARAATAYGSYVAAEFAASVAARGWAVVSGGAFGVDAAAHRGALSADGVTAAVLACGVDVPYPSAHTDLLDAIAAQGVLVSEWPPGRQVSRLRFLVRNRVIAALATGTLVVEASQRSGAINTARHARDLRRRLMAVPGPITSDLSAGCHHILREWQGVLVTSAAEVTENLSPLGAIVTAQLGVALLPRDALGHDQATVLDAMPRRGGSGRLRVAQRAGMGRRPLSVALASCPPPGSSSGATTAGDYAVLQPPGKTLRRSFPSRPAGCTLWPWARGLPMRRSVRRWPSSAATSRPSVPCRVTPSVPIRATSSRYSNTPGTAVSKIRRSST